MFSTCTLNPDENEGNTAFALRELGLELVDLRPEFGHTHTQDPVKRRGRNQALINTAGGISLPRLHNSQLQPLRERLHPIICEHDKQQSAAG